MDIVEQPNVWLCLLQKVNLQNDRLYGRENIWINRQIKSLVFSGLIYKTL